MVEIKSCSVNSYNFMQSLEWYEVMIFLEVRFSWSYIVILSCVHQSEVRLSWWIGMYEVEDMYGGSIKTEMLRAERPFWEILCTARVLQWLPSSSAGRIRKRNVQVLEAADGGGTGMGEKHCIWLEETFVLMEIFIVMGGWKEKEAPRIHENISYRVWWVVALGPQEVCLCRHQKKGLHNLLHWNCKASLWLHHCVFLQLYVHLPNSIS